MTAAYAGVLTLYGLFLGGAAGGGLAILFGAPDGLAGAVSLAAAALGVLAARWLIRARGGVRW